MLFFDDEYRNIRDISKLGEYKCNKINISHRFLLNEEYTTHKKNYEIIIIKTKTINI